MKPKLTIDKQGNKIWKLPNGDFHREDGPAIEWSNGDESWWLDGYLYTEKEYKYKMRSKKLELLL